MTRLEPRLFFDYVDPRSFVVDRRLRAVEERTGREAARHPFEVVVPPNPLRDPEDEAWRRAWEEAADAAEEDGTRLARPRIVPWSRKAHELALHAREEGVGREVHRALFDAFHLEGLDIGRVDVLVDLAVGVGLDMTHTRAVLDVDRHLEEVRGLRKAAERLGIGGVPTLLAGGDRSEGLVDAETLADLLRGSAETTPDDS